MIINSSQGNIEVYGDVKEFKTSIDPKNLEFITTLLSSNLYSDPEQSFIREIVSNAWDSHVEAGTTDIPVIIKFKDSYDEKSITIRDFGVGLSPERFREIYCNIGSSTKRESNEFIGGFGIGRYSALACSNAVYITSFYKGRAYYYIMVKSGNSITSNLLMEKPTEEKDGVEVTIKNISKLGPFDKALQCIIFFPNVYVDGAVNADNINNVKIKRFKYFAAASIDITPKLLLGNVLYPIEESHLKKEARDFISRIYRTGIAIKFDVGEINITPNRENIIYSSDTIKKIEDRIENAKAELEGFIIKKVAKDYSDILEYYEVIRKSINYDPVTDSIVGRGGYITELSHIPELSVTYNGMDLSRYLPVIKTIFNMSLPNFKGVIYDDKIYIKRMPWNVLEGDKLKTTNLLILNACARLTPNVKSYLRKNYDGYSVITDIVKADFKNWIKKNIGSYQTNMSYFDLILEGLYQSITKRAKRLDLNSDSDFLAYKSALTTSKSTDIPNIENCILYVGNCKNYIEKKSFKGLSQAVEFIKDLKKGVILANMDANDILLFSLANLKEFVYIKARKNIVSNIRKMNLSCIVDIDWLINKDPLLSTVHTIIEYFPNGINKFIIQESYHNLDKELQEEVFKLCRISAKYTNNNDYRRLATRENIPYDPYVQYLCLKLRSFLDKYERAKELSTTVGCFSPLLTTAVLIKTKAYRVSGEAYSKVKNNKLLKVLCRK